MKILISAIACLLVSSCSTIRFDSDPQGAAIIIDGIDTGKVTPAEFKVGQFRRGSHNVKVSLPGYQEKQGIFLLVKSKKRIFWTIFPPTALIAFPVNLFGNRWMKIELMTGRFNLEPIVPPAVLKQTE